MAERRVKLQDTGEIVSKRTPGIYQAPNKKYYSSEDAYLFIDLENTNRDKCVDLMYDFMNYDKKMKINTLFFKRLAEWHEGYPYNVIFNAMTMSAKGIEYANQSKEFISESGKLSYFMAIIQNNLNEALKLENLKKKVRSKVEQHGSLDAMIDGLENLSNTSTIKKGTYVSNLVGDL